MNKFEKENERIKDDIVRQYGRSLDYPTDCDALADEISTATGRGISSSTLKRLFGFVLRTTNFSKHTYDTLAVYVGFENWGTYHALGVSFRKTNNTNTEVWSRLKKQALRVTQFHYKSVTDCTGIEYNKAISRQFAEQHFDDFFQSDKLITAFVGPGGYGKSVMVAKLAERFFNNGILHNDILLLVDGGIIGNLLTTSYGLKNWLNDQLQYDDNSDWISILNDNPQFRLGRFVLMVDGFNEINLHTEKLQLFVNELLRIIAETIGKGWIKIVVTCRPKTWLMISQTIGDNKALRNAWFGVTFSSNYYEAINMPLLEEYEVSLIEKNLRRISEFEKLKLRHPGLIQNLRHPFFLQLYLQNNKDNNNLTQIDLFLEFTKETVLKGVNSEAKLELINQLVKESKYGLNGNRINKRAIQPLIEVYCDAFNELISFGIIYEYKELNHYLQYTSFIKFSQDNLFEFYTVTLWLREHQFDSTLLELIEQYYQNSELNFVMLQWLIKYAFYEKNVAVLKKIYDFIGRKIIESKSGFDTALYYELLFLIGSEIREYPELRKQLLPYYANSETGKDFYFESFNDIDFIILSSSDGVDSIDFYLEVSRSGNAVYFGHTVKFIKYFLTNDHQNCKNEYVFLNNTDTTGLNPYHVGLGMASLILFEHFYTGGISPNLIERVYAIEKTMPRFGQHLNEFPLYQFFVVEAFDLCKRYDLADVIFGIINSDYKNIEKFSALGYYKLLKVYEAHANLALTTEEYTILKARHLCYSMQLGNLPQNSRYYWTIRYFIVRYDFLIHESKIQEAHAIAEQIHEIARMMKFSFFEKMAGELK